ncbi:pyrroline-5-carboxylate reductase [Desulfatirhabdium butyrativorans]|uniref:pyrroline-5-carboxylate reductase n=1 Tax=Desulfatirhabdium butyrativorans TaxID=340467 RepID=UPI0004059E34|nr:pyrroline-5-carboxylate reductase [Desulfatirhabdium butyrativorans]
MSHLESRIGFVGAGNMAEAMIGALLQSNTANAENLFASDIDTAKLGSLRERYRIRSLEDNFAVYRESDILILAIKPQFFEAAVTSITKHPLYPVNARKLIVSIAAGIRIQKMERLFYEGLGQDARMAHPIIRVMPNTPALVLSGISGLSPNRFAQEDDIRNARCILEAMGEVLEFPEEQLDAVTAVSGSGPAYVFYLMEAMIAGAQRIGLEPEAAAVLVRETLRGAVELYRQSGENPEALRKKVTSPGGTTEAAIRILDEACVKQRWMAAIEAAAARSRELGNR